MTEERVDFSNGKSDTVTITLRREDALSLQYTLVGAIDEWNEPDDRRLLGIIKDALAERG